MTGRWNLFWFHLHEVLCVVPMIHLLSNECLSINLEGTTSDPFGALQNWNPSDDNPCKWTSVRCVYGKVITLLIDHSCTTIVFKLVIAFIFFQPSAKIYCASKISKFGGSFSDKGQYSKKTKKSFKKVIFLVHVTLVSLGDKCNLHDIQRNKYRKKKEEKIKKLGWGRSSTWMCILVLPMATLLLTLGTCMFLVCRSMGVPKLKGSELEAACEDFSNIVVSHQEFTVYKGTLSNGVEIAAVSTTITSLNDW
ncbi:unnamed protein product [Musa textilis]